MSSAAGKPLQYESSQKVLHVSCSLSVIAELLVFLSSILNLNCGIFASAVFSVKIRVFCFM